MLKNFRFPHKEKGKNPPIVKIESTRGIMRAEGGAKEQIAEDDEGEKLISAERILSE